RPDWVIRSRVVFLEADLRTPREPLPPDAFRLWLPYAIGDFYGSPAVPDYLQPAVAEDYGFEVDLNRSHGALQVSLERAEPEPSWLPTDPPGARIARMLTYVLEGDGIEQVGRAQWVDGVSGESLFLVYVDRPARIIDRAGDDRSSARHDVQADAAGYIWVAQRPGPDGVPTYVVVDAPENLVLAVTPAEDRAR
ncbi:MAG TPA: hypothetical protein VIL25_10955, partial [Vicinamibacterales bacterium]